ncbi:rRNA maturation RNase YbeY [Hoeflea prorocentri]|uniref:Endoribonuclease YbeY n=1 Tax=Hoeflea prorocentri TaxID=1922333 RepID=A0A9X3ULS7_9HYPH|nr:rRNA maturation RNase YbeY [Hoeflea prorocentri]MCY6382760.1 rRNA maturation RNase YbeY [Hoeflea prorocentri]MDA5400560.1 rRNA maturation RNase YbeY [Hoeflea prorocentri]
MPAGETIDIQISIEAGGWPDAGVLEALCARTIVATCDYLERVEGQPFPKAGCELSLLFADDKMVREINGKWRDQDKPTNVLSFPAVPVTPGQLPGPMLGDILFARETIAREADAMDIAFDNHLIHLLVHGFLHLLGYDHIDDDDARIMEGHETRILAMLNLSDPYENTSPA